MSLHFSVFAIKTVCQVDHNLNCIRSAPEPCRISIDGLTVEDKGTTGSLPSEAFKQIISFGCEFQVDGLRGSIHGQHAHLH